MCFLITWSWKTHIEFSDLNFENGEYVYDFGVDGIIDSNEFFYESNLLNIGTGTGQGLNDYSIVKNLNSSIFRIEQAKK